MNSNDNIKFDNATPKVSVCLLTYNHVSLIESTIDSVLNQKFSDFELILSDDNSTDGTYEKLLAIACRDNRIKVIKTPCNMRMPGNANFAVSHAVGEYIALLHHDDVCRYDMLEKWLVVMEKHNTATFAFNPYGRYGSDVIDGELIPGDLLSGDWLLKKYLFPRWGCLIRGTAMIRRSAWHACGGMNSKFDLLADIDLWMRLAMIGPVGYVPEPVITVRQERPDYYPEIYQADVWSWARLVYLYEIHAHNRLSYFGEKGMLNFIRWQWFRCRMGFDTVKWITYALVRKKKLMLSTCKQSQTKYDFLTVTIYRTLAINLSKLLYR